VLLKTTYKNGKVDGTIKSYFPGGQLQTEGNYKNGKQDGESKEYYENGKVRFIDTYENRRKVNRKTYNEKGKLELDEDF